jgi:hypothetical protein
MHPALLLTLLCQTADDFTRQEGIAAAQWINQKI